MALVINFQLGALFRFFADVFKRVGKRTGKFFSAMMKRNDESLSSFRVGEMQNLGKQHLITLQLRRRKVLIELHGA